MKTHKARTFLRVVVLLAVAFAGSNLAQAQSCNVEWTGDAGDGGQWSNAKNWSPHKVPGPTSDVCIQKKTGDGSCGVAASTQGEYPRSLSIRFW